MSTRLASATLPLLSDARLRRIAAPLKDIGEVAAVAAAVERQQRAGALFAGGIAGDGWPLVAHLAGDRARLAALFGLAPGELVPTLLRRLDIATATAASAATYPVVAEGAALDLTKLPLPAPSACAGILALAGGAQAGWQALTGFAILGRDRVALPALPPRLQAARGDSPAAAALILGPGPEQLVAASLSAEAGGDGWALASALAATPLPMIDTSFGPVPADAGLVLLGRLETAADGSGLTLSVTRLLRQERPLLPLLGGEGFALERLRFAALGLELAVARHIRNVEGGIDLIDVRALATAENRIVAVKFRPRVEGQSKTVLMATLSSPALRPLLAIGIDEDIDLDDPRDLGWAIASRLHAEYDVAVLRGLPTDSLAGLPVAADKWLIDATKPPLTQPERRAVFERAQPRGLDRVRLEDYLPAGSDL